MFSELAQALIDSAMPSEKTGAKNDQSEKSESKGDDELTSICSGQSNTTYNQGNSAEHT